ncbi:MAG: hypothetical protein MPJ25_14235, partial [Pirellulales bacterium]|nr:hypothetical protein [Pirellulales bacterium]
MESPDFGFLRKTLPYIIESPSYIARTLFTILYKMREYGFRVHRPLSVAVRKLGTCLLYTS